MFLKTFPHGIFSGHTCDICCLYDLCELTEVPSGSHEYESVSFFGFIFPCFCWLVGYVQCRAAVLKCYCSVLLTGGTKVKPSGESSFVSPQELQHEKNDRIKEDLMKEFELLQEGSKIFFNEICYKK